MRFKGLILLLLISPLIAEEPWGKDSQLVHSEKSCCPPARFGISSISFFQEVISPIDGIRSSYRPSSSGYMKDAINRYGFLTGIMMGMDRLLRENGDAWYYRSIEWEGFTMKYDPVN